MSESYSKPSQICKMMRHIEILGMVRTFYSGIFRDIQKYSAMLRHIEAIQALLRHTEPNSDKFRTLHNTCLYNYAIFRTLAYLAPKTSSKACWTCKMIQSPGIALVYLSIFKDIVTYSATLSHFPFCKMLHFKC